MSMSSFLHLLFDIVIISSVTRGLSQGGNLAKGALWPALRNNLRYDGESERGWLY